MDFIGYCLIGAKHKMKTTHSARNFSDFLVALSHHHYKSNDINESHLAHKYIQQELYQIWY